MVVTIQLDRSAIRFPATGHIWIPRHGRRAAAAGLSMHSPCTTVAIALQRALYAGVRIVGSGVIPGERVSWEAPAPPEQWDALVSAWTAETGGFDSIALYHRPQPGRIGFSALLLRNGRGVAFARVHPDDARVVHEFTVLSHLHAASPRTFQVARPISVGRIPSASWMLTASVPNYPLGAVRSATKRRNVATELSEILNVRMERPAGVPQHWVVAHGDFVPWNLRTDRGRVIVLDWEDAGFAPPGTDLLYGALTAHATFGSPLPSSAPHEAAAAIERNLTERIARQGLGGGDGDLLRALAGIPAV